MTTPLADAIAAAVADGSLAFTDGKLNLVHAGGSADAPPAARRTVGERSNLALRQPEAYKPGQDVAVWLKRMKLYIDMVKITAPEERAYLLTNALSQEAFAIMCDLHLPDEHWQQPAELEKSLLSRFGDKKTQAGYLIEFRAATQTAKEDVGAFLDRTEKLGRKSYPSVFTDRDSPVALELVLKQIQAGLKSDWVASELAKLVPRTMDELREGLVRFETLEAEASLRKKVANSHLVVAEPSAAAGDQSQNGAASSTTPPPASNFSGDGKSSKKRGKKNQAKGTDGQSTQSGGQKNGQNNSSNTGNGAQSNSTSAPFNGQCWNCGKSGHKGKDCRSAKNPQASGGPQGGHQGAQTQNSGPRRWQNGPLTCNRCGRNGHVQARCFSQQHVDGRPLAPATIVYGDAAAQAVSGVSSYTAHSLGNVQPLNYSRGATANRTSRPEAN
jgi:hypothetical protein